MAAQGEEQKAQEGIGADGRNRITRRKVYCISDPAVTRLAFATGSCGWALSLALWM